MIYTARASQVVLEDFFAVVLRVIAHLHFKSWVFQDGLGEAAVDRANEVILIVLLCYGLVLSLELVAQVWNFVSIDVLRLVQS